MMADPISLNQSRHGLIEAGKCLADAVISGSPAQRIARLAGEYVSEYEASCLRLRGCLPGVENPRLTARESRAIALMLEGNDTKTIATLMGISPLTVKTHLRNARTKT